MGQRRQRVKTFHEEATGEELTDCGDFKVLDDWVLDGRAITFFDRDGNEDSAIVHLTFQDRFYNSETGKDVTGTAHDTVRLDLPEEREIWSAGAQLHATTPGGGLVVLSAGRITFDEQGNAVFEGGHHPTLGDPSELSDTERELLVNLCEALAGN
jgi:hypothetical protein